MNRQTLHQTLNKMIGQLYSYNDQVHKILNFKIDNYKVTIATDQDILEMTAKNAPAELKKFKPVGSEVSKALASIPRNEEMKSLRDILMDTISRVRNDEGYTTQAHVINKSVNSMIAMAKIELQAYALQNSINGKSSENC
ncbi:MAG: hypothetical protein ACE5I1_32630 [bacterium]